MKPLGQDIKFKLTPEQSFEMIGYIMYTLAELGYLNNSKTEFATDSSKPFPYNIIIHLTRCIDMVIEDAQNPALTEEKKIDYRLPETLKKILEKPENKFTSYNFLKKWEEANYIMEPSTYDEFVAANILNKKLSDLNVNLSDIKIPKDIAPDLSKEDIDKITEYNKNSVIREPKSVINFIEHHAEVIAKNGTFGINGKETK